MSDTSRIGVLLLAVLLALACTTKPVAAPAQADGIRIVSPAPGTVVRPGSEVKLVVEPTGAFEPKAILVALGGRIALLKSPPFETTLTVEANAHGTLRLSVMARGDDFDQYYPQEVALVVENPHAGALDSVPPIVPVTKTQGMQSVEPSSFTISPDDRWLVYFDDLGPSRRSGRHYLFGDLRVLDLATDIEYEMTIGEDAFHSYGFMQDCWSPDSRYCVIPPPGNRMVGRAPEMFLEMTESGPRLVVQKRQVPWKEATPLSEQVPYHKLSTSGFTCSDCYDRRREESLLRANIDEQWLRFVNRKPSGNILSPNGSTIYYQRGYGTRRSTLYELDVARRRERELISFDGTEGDCVMIRELTPSPDLRKLAFHVTTRCGGDAPTLYVMNLGDGSAAAVANIVYGGMHWNSSSNRLYFYKCQIAGGCGKDDGLYYVEVGG